MDDRKRNKIKKHILIGKDSKREVGRTAAMAAGAAVLAALLLMASGKERAGAMGMEAEMAGKGSCQEQIADDILRLHVVANSDREEDQQLKLKVKEKVLDCLRPKLAGAKNAKEAEKIIESHMEEIQEAANGVILEEGFSYESQGVLGKAVFPVKQYGDLIFPAGEYDALRILLGEAKGKNWWCVMFPTLCYVDEACDAITEENKEQFKEILTEDEYESLLAEEGSEEGQIFYKLKVAAWVNKVIDYFSK